MMTRRILPFMLLSLFLFLDTGLAQKKNVTIIGEVVDLVSYMTSGSKPDTPAGKEILEASARGGNPLGILEAKTGKIYVVTMKRANTAAREALLPFVGIRVAASGDVYTKGGCDVLVMSVIGKSIK